MIGHEHTGVNRRQYVGALCGGLVGGIAGCTAPTDSAGAEASPATEESPDRPVTGEDGSPQNICERGAQPGLIPAIVSPAFAPADDAPELDDAEPIVGIERAGEARAYPVSTLRYEVVNDSFDVPVLVTFCPLCSSGLTAIRRVDGRETVFGNTGHTWTPPGAAGRAAIGEDRVFGISSGSRPSRTEPTNDPNLVMFDEQTGSFWSQLLSQAICGPATGQTLTLVPSTVTEWGEWRVDHPETSVLLPPPESDVMTG